MRSVLRRPSPATVISLIALFVALGGTSYAAISISGKNVKNGSLSGADVKNNSLTGKDVTSLKGGDVKNGSLTGADVAESKLGKVPSAAAADTAQNANALGGQPASTFAKSSQDTLATAFAGDCGASDSATFRQCGSASVTVPRTARLVMFGELPYRAPVVPAKGSCRYKLDGSVLATSPTYGTKDGGSETTDYRYSAPFNAMTNPVTAGQHDVALECNDLTGTIHFSITRVTVFVVSPK
jgi:hypothetical protein